jgi:hypothetical protein
LVTSPETIVLTAQQRNKRSEISPIPQISSEKLENEEPLPFTNSHSGLAFDSQTAKIAKAFAEANSQRAKRENLQKILNLESAQNSRLRNRVQSLEKLSKNYTAGLRKPLFRSFNFERRRPNETIFLIQEATDGQPNFRLLSTVGFHLFPTFHGLLGFPCYRNIVNRKKSYLQSIGLPEDQFDGSLPNIQTIRN